MTAVTDQTTSSQNGDPTVRPMSADTMNTPDPIIDPATNMVASVSVSAWMKPARSPASGAAASSTGAALSIPPLWRCGSGACAELSASLTGVRSWRAPAAGPAAQGGSARARQNYPARDGLARDFTPRNEGARPTAGRSSRPPYRGPASRRATRPHGTGSPTARREGDG